MKSNKKMNILLINPPIENLIRTFAPDSITEEMGIYPPMGLLYIASFAKKRLKDSINIKILDMQVERMSYPELENYLQKNQFDVIGITCMTFLLVDALKTAKIIKKINNQTRVVVGGTHPTLFPYETLSQKEIDFVVIGEGEESFTEILTAILNQTSFSDIKGIGYKEDNKLRITPRRNFIQNLDLLPFPNRRLLHYQKYYNLIGDAKKIMTSLLTSRGCPHNCIFCTHIYGRVCRMRSPENVVQEIEECVKLGIIDFNIIDDTFTINRKRVLSIAKLIIEKKLDITMDIRARVDQVDEDLINLLAKAGCTRIRFGVESGSNEVLKRLRKGINLEQVKYAFKIANRAGITTFAYFMLGSPGESIAEIKESIKLAKSIEPDYVQFLITTPFPATDLYKEGLDKGILKSDYWKEFVRSPSANFSPQWWTEILTREELIKWQKKAHLYFYYRPKYILRQIKQLNSFKEFWRKKEKK